MEMFAPVHYRPLLGRVPYLGAPGPGKILVSVYDENGRPFPNVKLDAVLPAPATAPAQYNVGPTGQSEIDVSTLPSGGTVVLTPNVSMDFVSDPPFHEIELKEGVPSEVSFVVAMRQPEKDYTTPIITWIIGGLATGLALWLVTKYGSKL